MAPGLKYVDVNVQNARKRLFWSPGGGEPRRTHETQGPSPGGGEPRRAQEPPTEPLAPERRVEPRKPRDGPRHQIRRF